MKILISNVDSEFRRQSSVVLDPVGSAQLEYRDVRVPKASGTMLAGQKVEILKRENLVRLAQYWIVNKEGHAFTDWIRSYCMGRRIELGIGRFPLSHMIPRGGNRGLFLEQLRREQLEGMHESWSRSPRLSMHGFFPVLDEYVRSCGLL